MNEIDISCDIWKEYKNNPCVETRNMILMNYVKLVKEIAYRLAPSYKNHIDYDDLFSSGIFGLMDAIEKYDANKNIKFETYASWRIKGAIIDYIREQDWIPRSLRKKIKDVEDAYRDTQRLLGREPTDNEVANSLGISICELNKILTESSTYQIISMDEQIMNSLNFDADIEDNSFSPESRYQEEELKKELASALEKLTENERLVISLYYFEEISQKEISKVLKISESRVSQIHSKALMKMKIHMEKYTLAKII